MNLTFDADAADAELLALRHNPYVRMQPPMVGRWFDADYDAKGYPRCALCGYADRLVTDHCHITGLIRGRLCCRCNRREGFENSPALDAWRLTAPGLVVGRREFYRGWSSGREGLAHSTEEQLLTLPITELVMRAAEWWRQQWNDGVKTIPGWAYDLTEPEVRRYLGIDTTNPVGGTALQLVKEPAA